MIRNSISASGGGRRSKRFIGMISPQMLLDGRTEGSSPPAFHFAPTPPRALWADWGHCLPFHRLIPFCFICCERSTRRGETAILRVTVAPPVTQSRLTVPQGRRLLVLSQQFRVKDFALCHLLLRCLAHPKVVVCRGRRSDKRGGGSSSCCSCACRSCSRED